MPAFRFKQFQIEHDHSFKVGTDGVLLGAWASIEDNTNILEIGSGSGLITIMLAQRSVYSKITGVEIDGHSVKESRTNSQKCPWNERIKIIESGLQNFKSNQKFDHIITNPPFFVNSTKSDNKRKNETRHNDSLSFEEIIDFAQKHLKSEGTLSIILPKDEGEIFIENILQKGFSISRITHVRSKIDKPIERILMEFIYSTAEKRNIEEQELVIQNEKRNDYTGDYINLTKEFYINM